MFSSMFGSGTQLTVLYVVAILAMLYLLMIRPQKKQMKIISLCPSSVNSSKTIINYMIL